MLGIANGMRTPEFAFFKAFTLTTDDQLSILGPVDIDQVDPAVAAAD